MEDFPHTPEPPLPGKQIGFVCSPVWQKKESERQ
jgi:hypothetical protein